MKRIDTLQAYEDLIEAGQSPTTAKAHIRILVESQEIDLNILKTEFRFMNLKLYYLMAIGTVMASIACVPKISAWWG